MKIFTRPQCNPSVLFVVSRYLHRHENAWISKNDLLTRLRPLNEESLRALKDVKDNLTLGLDLNLFEESDQRIRLGKPLSNIDKPVIARTDFLPVLREKVLKVPSGGFTIGSGSTLNADFVPTLAWWLGRSPVVGFPSGRKLGQRNLLEEAGVESRSSLVKQNTQWPVFVRWAIHLGFIRKQRTNKRGELLFPTLVTPFENFFDNHEKGEVIKAEILVKQLQKSFPMIDGTKLAKDVDKFLGSQREASNKQIGPVVHDALLTLEEKGRIKLYSATDNAEENVVFKSSNSGLQTISRIEIQ